MTSLSPDTDDSHRIKRRRIETTADISTTTTTSTTIADVRWRSQTEQQTYATKLLEALRHVTRRNNPSPSANRAVREAADKVLAIAARGRTRWSHAILSNRMKLRLKTHKKAKVKKPRFPVPVLTGNHRLSEKTDKLPEIDKRLKVLGRLVPGCRKLSFPNLLEETTDYIAALQMQVRAMSALAELLASGSSSGSDNLNIGPVHPS